MGGTGPWEQHSHQDRQCLRIGADNSSSSFNNLLCLFMSEPMCVPVCRVALVTPARRLLFDAGTREYARTGADQPTPPSNLHIMSYNLLLLCCCRYPQGESYLDLVQRLWPVVHQLEHSQGPVVVVAHQVSTLQVTVASG